MKFVVVLILLLSCVSLQAYYYTYTFGKRNLYLDGSVGFSRGNKQYFNFYTRYGVLDDLDVNISMPDMFYYDGDVKKGTAFYSNPTVGYFLSFINDDKNKFGTYANFMLPFRTERGLNMDVAVIYSRNIAERWNLINGLDIPFNKYSGNPTNVSLTYLLGTEYTKGAFFSQLILSFSEQLVQDKQFGLGTVWYTEYAARVVSPYIELSYDVRPIQNWSVLFGFFRLFNL